MTRINQLSSTSSLQSGDQLAVYSLAHGDTRKASLGTLKDYVLEGGSGGGSGGTVAIDDVTGLQDALDGKEASGTASSFMSAHLLDPDPHTQYTTAAEAAAVAPVQSVAGKTGIVTLAKADVGLSNVDNTSDANKPVSTAQATAIGAKADQSALTAHATDTANPHSVTKAQVGLGNADNTSDANKPVSTAQQTALNLKADLTSNTFSGAQVYSDQQISRGMMKDMADVFSDKGNSGTTTQTLDYTAGSHQKITATGNHTIATSNWPPSGNLGEMLLELVNGGAFTITWPTVNWIKSDGSTTTTFSSNGVTLQTSGTDWVLLWSRDAGATIYGKIVR